MEELGGAVAEMRRAFEEWLPKTHTGHRVVVKRAIKVAKRMADWRWEERLGNDFKGNKKMVLDNGTESEER